MLAKFHSNHPFLVILFSGLVTDNEILLFLDWDLLLLANDLSESVHDMVGEFLVCLSLPSMFSYLFYYIDLNALGGIVYHIGR
jgi:hypothetical protein